MPWYQDGFFMAFVAFPALAAVLGLLAGAISNRYWPGAVAGALTTVILIFTVANETLLVWMPVHAIAGFAGGALGRFGRSKVRSRSSGGSMKHD